VAAARARPPSFVKARMKNVVEERSLENAISARAMLVRRLARGLAVP
jgi:hypothetical protein